MMHVWDAQRRIQLPTGISAVPLLLLADEICKLFSFGNHLSKF